MARDLRLAVASLPDRFAIWCMCAVLAVAICVQFEIFQPWTVGPLFLALVVISWRMAPTVTDRSGAAIVGVVLAFGLAAAWFVVHRNFHSELLSVRRDPSIYTLRGIWLIDHPSPDVVLTQQLLDLRKAVPEARLDFGGETGRLTRYFQSTTVVPGFIAIGGWLGGIPLLLQTNVAIGAGGLIAVYAIGRRMAGPLFGLIPVVALALCMPLAAFSRAPYTEPLSLIAVAVGLLGLWTAWTQGRRALWVLAGIGCGAVMIARIDGSLVVSGAYVGLGLLGGLAASDETRRRALAAIGWFSLGALPVGALGMLDLVVHSPDYLHALKSEAMTALAAIAVSATLAVVVTLLPPMRSLGGWLLRHRRGASVVSALVVAAIVVAMFLRPLLFTFHGLTGLYATGVGRRQKAEGLPLDPTRSYDEQSITWLSWYFGWPAVVTAAVAGIAAVVFVVRKRDAPLLLVTALVAFNAAFYLNQVNITPDQIWAMRRFLPVIVPGLLLLAAWGLFQLVTAARLRWETSTRKRWMGTAPVVVLAAVIALWPATTWGAMLKIREGAGQYDMVRNVCTYLPSQKVLILGSAPVAGHYQPTFRNMCGKEVIWLKESTPENIAKVVSAWQPGPISAVTFNPQQVPWSTPQPPVPVVAIEYQMWASVLASSPRHGVTESTKVWVGEVQPNGTVAPLG